MTRLGAFLALFGFGSALLHFTDVQFRLLMWAEEWQPFLGLGVGALGAVFLLIPTLMNKDQPAEGQQGFAPQPGGYGPPPASPPGGFAQPPGPGYGQPNPGYQAAPQGAYPPPGPQFGQPYGQQPPQQQNFGPQGGPPFGPQGR